jgi:hypothetical protein
MGRRRTKRKKTVVSFQLLIIGDRRTSAIELKSLPQPEISEPAGRFQVLTTDH